MIKICEICSIEFKVAPSCLKTRKTCSKPCQFLKMKSQFSFWNTCSKEEAFQRIKDLYEKKVVKNEEGCWGWRGNLSSSGYGEIKCGKKRTDISKLSIPPRIASHRVSWMIHNGEISNGLCVLHTCDTRVCSKISHLFLGTVKDNYDDMISKGRRKYITWEKAPKTKLNPDKVREIRKLLIEGVSLRILSIKYEVSKHTIGCIRDRKVWKHLE